MSIQGSEINCVTQDGYSSIMSRRVLYGGGYWIRIGPQFVAGARIKSPYISWWQGDEHHVAGHNGCTLYSPREVWELEHPLHSHSVHVAGVDLGKRAMSLSIVCSRIS